MSLSSVPGEPSKRQTLAGPNRRCLGYDAAACYSRRGFLRRNGLGAGWLAFLGLAGRDALGANLPRVGPHPPQAKHVIFLFMDGGVSHVDTFDPKPELTARHGQPVRWKSDTLSQAVGAGRKWLGSPWQFRQHGESGLWVSSLFPKIAETVDRLCVVRSLVGETPLHGAQALLLHTGRSIGAAPSLGSWLSYGLGSESVDLPSYVLLNNDWIPNGGYQNFASSFLPASHQATMLRATDPPMDNVVPHDPPPIQDAKLRFLSEQDEQFAALHDRPDEVESAIRNYETAARMQTEIPNLCDVSDETAQTLGLYGVDRSNDYDRFYALQCLRARRLVEAGVRFVEVTCPLTHSNNAPWDQHGALKLRHEENARITDQPVAALLIDLEQRGLLEETLVVWAGEMGRTPHSAGDDGRDHHVGGYTIWMAGGGVRPGIAYGATDELGMNVVDGRVDVHDIHATILHQMGLDHESLTYRFGGRDMRLTDVHGRVIREIISA